MHVRVVSIAAFSLLTATVVGSLTGCAASFDQRMAYLKKVSNEGVQTHRLIVSTGGTTTNKRCTDAYNGLQDMNPPADQDLGNVSSDWTNQIQAFFVQSCVTGLPKAVPGQPSASTSVSPSPSKSTSASPSASPKR